MKNENGSDGLFFSGRLNRFTITRRKFLKAAGAIAAAASVPFPARLSKGQGLTPVKVTLSWIPSGAFAYLYVAKKLGYWEKRGLDVQIDRGFGSGEAIKNVGLGLYDFGHVDFTSLIISIAKEIDVAAIASVVHTSPIGIFSLKSANITKPKDIEGKRFGTSSAGADYLLFPAFAKAAGIDESKVKVMFLKPDIQNPMLIEGKIDFRGSFYTTFAPEFWARGHDFNMILYAQYGLKLYGPGLITQRKNLKEKKDLCAKFVAGAMEGLAYTYLNLEKSIEIFWDAVPEYKASPQGKDVIKHGIGTTNALGIIDFIEEKGLGWYDREMVKETLNIMAKYMNLEKIPSLDSVYTNEFVGNVKLTQEEWKIVKAQAQKYLLK